MEALLCRYETIFSSHDYELGRMEIASHTIRPKPGAEPIHSRSYSCSEQQREELRLQLQEMRNFDIIDLAYGGFSLCLLVKKPNTKSKTVAWSLCQSFSS